MVKLPVKGCLRCICWFLCCSKNHMDKHQENINSSQTSIPCHCNSTFVFKQGHQWLVHILGGDQVTAASNCSAGLLDPYKFLRDCRYRLSEYSPQSSKQRIPPMTIFHNASHLRRWGFSFGKYSQIMNKCHWLQSIWRPKSSAWWEHGGPTCSVPTIVQHSHWGYTSTQQRRSSGL